MRNPNSLTGTLSLALLLGACSPSVYTLRMAASRPPSDESAVSPRLVASRYTKIMVIPPSGSARGQFDSTISIFEAEFLKLGITVISGAVTGRVVLSNEIGTEEKRVEGAAQLSDAERALIMAKKTGAHAVLQVGEFTWSSGDEPPGRYFTADQASLQYREVDEGTLQSVAPQYQWTLLAPRLRFIGKLIDVESGEVIASFKITAAANGCVRSDYVAQHRIAERAEFASANYDYGAEVGSAAAKDRCIQAVVQSVAHHIGSGAVAGAPMPPAPPPMMQSQYAPPPQAAPPAPLPPQAPQQPAVAPAPAPAPAGMPMSPPPQAAPLPPPPPQYVPAPPAPPPAPAKASGPSRGGKAPPAAPPR